MLYREVALCLILSLKLRNLPGGLRWYHNSPADPWGWSVQMLWHHRVKLHVTLHGRLPSSHYSCVTRLSTIQREMPSSISALCSLLQNTYLYLDGDRNHCSGCHNLRINMLQTVLLTLSMFLGGTQETIKLDLKVLSLTSFLTLPNITTSFNQSHLLMTGYFPGL